MNKRACGLAVLFLIFAAHSVHAKVIAALRPFPDTTLPGVPVSFGVTVTNTDTTEARFVDVVQMEVQPATGPAYIVEWGRGEAGTGFIGEALDDDGMLRVAAGSSRGLYIRTDQMLLEPAFFWDSRLNTPGRRQLRVLLLRAIPDVQPVKVVSNWTTLDTIDPAGVDAQVWQLMAAVNGGWNAERWASTGLGLAMRIVDEFSQSGYYPYALLLYPSSSDTYFDHVAEALARKPAGPVADRLRMRSATVHARRSDVALADGRLDVAADEARKARNLLDELIRETPYPFVRQDAAAFRQRVRDPDSIRGPDRAQHTRQVH